MSQLLHARVARERMSVRSRVQQKVTIYQMKDALDKAISLAIQNGLSQATINAPAEAEAPLLNALKAALEKLGYRVTLQYQTGILEPGFIREPQTTVTVGW